jgi:hypothetical protein
MVVLPLVYYGVFLPEIRVLLPLKTSPGKHYYRGKPTAVGSNRFDHHNPGRGFGTLFICFTGLRIANDAVMLYCFRLLYTVLIDVGYIPRRDVFTIDLVL